MTAIDSGSLKSWFACSEGCAFRAPLTDVVYRCEQCGGLLEVQHDMDALRRVTRTAWQGLFQDRLAHPRLPWASGVWGKKEWVYPELADAEIVSLGEGRSPLLPLPRTARRLGLASVDLKQCGVSATGSFKDLGMTVLVSAVVRMRNVGKPLRAVVCASTGDTSAALSAYCAAAGIPAVVILPKDKISLAQLVQPLANGAHVFSLSTDFDGCMGVVQELTRDSTLYLANSMNSLRLEGQKTVGIEVCQQLGWEVPDWIVIPGGNLGNASALGRGFLMLRELGLISRLPRLAVAQAERANPLYRAFTRASREVEPVQAQATLASAIQIGNPVSSRRALKMLQALDGVVEQASESELAHAAASADLEGAFCCPHTGVALAALEKLSAQGIIASGSRVVVVSTAHGLKFPEFKIGYHRGALEGVDTRLANGPIEVAPTADALRRELDRRLDGRASAH
jgi:threonine synthase